MILIITHKEDFTADFVINQLNERHIPYYRFNCEDIQSIPLEFSDKNSFAPVINGVSLFSSVWFRRTKLPSIKIDSHVDRDYLLADYDTLLHNLFETIQAQKWISKPRKVYRAENKILQLRIASDVGFEIPRTIITNSHNHLNEFVKKFGDDLIIKPINIGKIENQENSKLIFTSQLTSDILARVSDFDLTPAIIQTRIEKLYELRVTVVGNKVFAAKCESQSNDKTLIDWRADDQTWEKYELPLSVAKQCLKLVNSLGLHFGAIDLIRTKNDGYTFLEINPNGQWAWLDIEMNLGIADAIIDQLK